ESRSRRCKARDRPPSPAQAPLLRRRRSDSRRLPAAPDRRCLNCRLVTEPLTGLGLRSSPGSGWKSRLLGRRRLGVTSGLGLLAFGGLRGQRRGPGIVIRRARASRLIPTGIRARRLSSCSPCAAQSRSPRLHKRDRDAPVAVRERYHELTAAELEVELTALVAEPHLDVAGQRPRVPLRRDRV